MFWTQITEVEVEPNSKKVVLERVTLSGIRERVKFIEMPKPGDSQASESEMISVTQRRLGWRFRLWHPLKVTYYKRNKEGDWAQIGTGVP